MTTFQTFSGMEDVLWIRITSNRADSFFSTDGEKRTTSDGGGGGNSTYFLFNGCHADPTVPEGSVTVFEYHPKW